MMAAHLNGSPRSGNVDPKTVEGFGVEWSRFDQKELKHSELQKYFDAYFSLFPWSDLRPDCAGFDVGCGSGRWARLVAPRVGHLHCVDASKRALEVAGRILADHSNCTFHHSSVEDVTIEDASLDFGYSLGVLHHVPNTAEAIAACVRKLKPGAPFLIYLYYALENRPVWFRALWSVTERLRRGVSRLPDPIKLLATDAIALSIYWPMARAARVAENLGLQVEGFPLSYYRRSSLYTMRTDALDRFGTRLEQRFTSSQIREMMERAGLERVRLADGPPFWCAIGYRKAPSAE